MPEPFSKLSKNKLFNDVNGMDRMLKRLTHEALKSIMQLGRWNCQIKHAAMIVYPTDRFGSLGDQAMLIAAMQGLRLEGFSRITLIAEEAPSRIQLPQFANSVLNPKLYFNGTTIDAIRFQRHFATNKDLFVLGADMMDGYYSIDSSLQLIHLLSLAASFGLNCKVFGFSFNDKPSDEVIGALRALPREVELLARDPLSQRRLEKNLERPIRLVADLAFLLKPDPEGESAKSTLTWISGQRSQGAKLVGINSNALLSRGVFTNPLPVATGLARTILSLHKAHPELKFVMIPHDSRGHYNDEILNRIAAEMAVFDKGILARHIYFMPTPCSAAEVKAVCSKLDLVIAGRMHLAIACLGECTPVICVGYQGKMEGLFEFFDLKNMVVSPGDAFNANGLADMALAKLDKATELREDIKRQLPKAISLAKLNFQ